MKEPLTGVYPEIHFFGQIQGIEIIYMQKRRNITC